jgi:hypothetical protein
MQTQLKRLGRLQQQLHRVAGMPEEDAQNCGKLNNYQYPAFTSIPQTKQPL